MDYSNYDERTLELVELMHEQKRNVDKKVLETLDELKKTADSSNDNMLLGFTYFHIADALYSFEMDYGEFHEALKKAIYHLQMANDKFLLSRAYNYVATDAMHHNGFDVAYFYMMNALQNCEEIEDDYMMSITNNNIGQVFAKLGHYAKAIEYVRESNRLQMKCSREDPYFIQNAINGFFSEGVLSVQLNDLEGAKRADSKIAELELEEEAQAQDSNIDKMYIPVAFLRLQIAVMEGDEEKIEHWSNRTLEALKDGYRIYAVITDVEDMCNFLIKNERYSIVRDVLDLIQPVVQPTDVVLMQSIITELELSYYEAVGNEEKVNELLRIQHELSRKQKNEQENIIMYSIELINSMNELRKDREMIMSENISLQKQAETDGLTGIPNRLALDRHMAQSLEQMSGEGRNFGVSFIDIDKFKEYNDRYGHQAGDECLKKVAGAIASFCNGKNTYCARYGGDEFVMFFEDMTDEEIIDIATSLEEMVERLDIENSGSPNCGRVSLSQGLCNGAPGAKATLKDYMTESDNALYAIKKNLSNRRKGQSFRLIHLPETV